MINFFFLAFTLFIVGSLGMFLLKKHVINIIISLELILVSINIQLIAISSYLIDILGQLFSLLILTLAASETALGLSMVVIYYRLRGGISVDLLHLVKG